MRLLKALFGLLLLRWLPSGFVTRWLLRFALWGGLGYTIYRALKPQTDTTSNPAMTQSWSGWAPPVDEPPAESRTSTVPQHDDTQLDEGAEVQSVLSEAEALTEEIAGGESGIVAATVVIAVNDPISAEPTPEPAAPIIPNWVRGDGSEHCPPEYPIKAKASSLIYHSGESRNYEVTIPDVCFATVEDAEAAGYRAPRR